MQAMTMTMAAGEPPWLQPPPPYEAAALRLVTGPLLPPTTSSAPSQHQCRAPIHNVANDGSIEAQDQLCRTAKPLRRIVPEAAQERREGVLALQCRAIGSGRTPAQPAAATHTPPAADALTG